LTYAPLGRILIINGKATSPAKNNRINTMFTLQETLIINQAKDIIAAQLVTGTAFTSPSAVKDFCLFELGFLQHEVFAVIFLNQRHQMIAFDQMFRGTIDGASVYPREVAKAALAHNAAAVIFTHNHPSGVADPSQSDERITSRLVDALGLFDIRVLDHIIVGKDTAVSFADRGLL